MPFTLPDVWTWDMWFADDGTDYHVFYLKASRALGDPNRRHFHVTIGHAISDDLRTWREVPDALIVSDEPAFDDYTTWTGSVVRDDDGGWRMFYTGTSRSETGVVQRIGAASSPDLYSWTKRDGAVTEADPRWYEKFGSGQWFDEAWRDPWVYRDADGGWHMLITARANTGDADNRGVIGHATSADLDTWTVQPPLSASGAGFGQLEVPQLATIDQRQVLIFSCLTNEMSSARRIDGSGGVWAVTIDDPNGPFPIDSAVRLTDESLYAGRLIQHRSGQWFLFAFCHVEADGEVVGALSDPIPVSWGSDGDLRVTDGRFDHLRTHAPAAQPSSK